MPREFTGFLEGKDSKKIYKESGSAIKLLIDKFGKKKLFEFFSKQKEVQNPKTLEKVFKEVYGDDLNYKFFNKLSKEALNE